MLNRVVEPDVSIELVPVSHEKAGRTERFRIIGSDLVASEHFPDHLVVADVGIQRFDDPVARSPDVRLALLRTWQLHSRPSRYTARRPSSAGPIARRSGGFRGADRPPAHTSSADRHSRTRAIPLGWGLVRSGRGRLVARARLAQPRRPRKAEPFVLNRQERIDRV